MDKSAKRIMLEAELDQRNREAENPATLVKLHALRERVLVLEEFLYDLDLNGGLGGTVHKRLREVLGLEAGAAIAARRAREQYVQTRKVDQ